MNFRLSGTLTKCLTKNQHARRLFFMVIETKKNTFLKNARLIGQL